MNKTILIAMMMSIPAFAADTKTELKTEVKKSEGTWSCKHGNAVRKVEIKYTEAGKKVPCQVTYSKENETEGKVIFSANAKEGFCEEKAKAFAEKLGTLGYPCE